MAVQDHRALRLRGIHSRILVALLGSQDVAQPESGQDEEKSENCDNNVGGVRTASAWFH